MRSARDARAARTTGGSPDRRRGPNPARSRSRNGARRAWRPGFGPSTGHVGRYRVCMDAVSTREEGEGTGPKGPKKRRLSRVGEVALFVEVHLSRPSGRLARQAQADIGTEASRILLIEDNPRHAQLLREALGEVVPAVSGLVPYDLTHVPGLAEGLERLSNQEFDVVLLDLSLPEAPGLDALVRIRERHEDVPVIALTARGEDDLAIQSIQAGAQDFLQKGRITGELLTRAIRAAVHISNLQAALRSLSFIDGLTGLYNRRGFVTLGDPYIKRAQRQKGQFLIVSADVAGLKQINTIAGYDEGDRVLRAVAEILKKT